MKQRSYLLGFLVILTMALFTEGCSENSEASAFENASFSPAKTCGLTHSGLYNYSENSYRDTDTIHYYVDYGQLENMEELGYMTEMEAEQTIDRAWAFWSQHIGKPIVEVKNVDSAEIHIQFEFLDGYGGVLGQAEFPPAEHKHAYFPRHVKFDKYDIARVDAVEGRPVYEFFRDSRTRVRALDRTSP